MDLEKDDTATGSLVSLSKKPPVKGRKKKSAVAKLAEKRRLNSDGTSEYGSTFSLQRTDNFGSKNSITASRDNVNNNNKDSVETDKDTAKKSVSDTNSKNSTENLKNLEKDSKVPKPIPRKFNQQKKSSSSEVKPDPLEGGTVVSIYDKVEKPPRRPSRESSPRSNKKANESTQHSSKRQLFPNDDLPKSDLSFLSSAKHRTGLSPLGDLPPLDKKSPKLNNVENSPPVPMDLDNDSDKEEQLENDEISKKAPSDATVHRFRNLRMGPDRSKSEESLKHAQFAPKPPSTPRSARRNSAAKGEKRNRDANSSGEEPDIEIKKQNSIANMNNETIANTSLSNLQAIGDDTMEVDEIVKQAPIPVKRGLGVHPDVKEVTGQEEYNWNQNMNLDPKITILDTPSPGANSESPIEISPDKTFNVSPDKLAFESSPEKEISPIPEKKPEKKAGRKKVKKGKVKPFPETMELAPLDGGFMASPGKSSIDTIGSASDLRAITENYKEVLKAPGPNLQTNVSPHPAPAFNSVIPEPKANAGKLSPIQPRTLPPPLPQDMKSTSLRTTYKADPAYPMSKFFGRSFSGQTEREKIHLETMSNRSFSTSTTLHSLSTREARDRMKQGTMGSSLLSSPELDRYFPDRKVGLWVGSWNMAEIKDCKEPLDDFLLPEISEYVQDIYAIGTQENAMSKKEWEILLQETIGPSHVLFHSASHGALHLAVFVKRDLIWFCTVPEDDLVQTRAVTMVKTKGAIAIGFQFFGTSLLFINCHFAPGDDKKKERIDDYVRIIKNLHLPKQGNTGSPNGNPKDVTTRFDCVFWMGDLNFRIEVYKGKQAVEDIVKVIQQQEHPNFEDLVSGDQLTKLIVEGSIFQGFQEGRINFRPTYKFDLGNDTYDTSSKNRIPSYTDRVLFRAKKKNSITCTHYDSPCTVKVSDHRPVFALFEAAVQPARECSLPLAAGHFDRSVYTEANRRRFMKVEVIKTLQKEKSSKVCSIQ